MFGPMSSEPVNPPSQGLRADCESSSFTDYFYPSLFLFWDGTGPCLWVKGRADCKYIATQFNSHFLTKSHTPLSLDGKER